MALMNIRLYSKDGNSLGGAHQHLPEYLDWMDIDVKAHWFITMGFGHPDTRYALLESQGQQKLIQVESLQVITPKIYEERSNGAAIEVERFIKDGGYSRTPRNQ